MGKQTRRAKEAAAAKRNKAAAYAASGKSRYQAKRERKFPGLELAPRPQPDANRDKDG